jgi:hypothetical protein
MSSQGELGNVGEPPVSVHNTRMGGPGDHRPWRDLGASIRSRARWETTNAVKQARYWEASDKRSDPKWAGGSLSGASDRGRWGTTAHGTHGREGDAGHHAFLGGPLGETPGSRTVSMQLQSIAQQAKRSPERVCNKVLHVIDRAFVLEASRQTRKNSAPGVDQVTATQYAENLDTNLRDLYERRRDHR